MAGDVGSTHLRQWVSTTDIMIITLLWSATFAVLVFRVARARRWDTAWGEQWERDHGQPLAALHRTKQRNLRLLMGVRWLTIALFLMALGAVFGPTLGALKGLRAMSPLVVEAFAVLILLLLLAVAVLFATVAIAKYEIRRIDELTAGRQ